MRALRSFGAIVMIWTAGRGLLLYATGTETEIGIPFAVAPPSAGPEAAVAEKSAAAHARDVKRQRVTWPRFQAVTKRNNLIAVTPSISDAVSEAQIAIVDALPTIDTARQHDDVPMAATLSGRPAERLTTRSLISGSAYVFVRSGGQAGGVRLGDNLGGSQASFRLAGPEIASARNWTLRPFARATGALAPADFDETAAGLTVGRRWPSAFASASVEHRFRTGRNGRNAIAASLAGGMATSLPATGLTLSGYGQAGFVGLSRRDAFADAEIRIETAPIPTTANIRLGLAAWGGVQPGVSRVDVGPSLSLPIKAGAASLSIRADWRFRVAGKAQPGSGPALTLATDF
jgi:hypothetical protein